jgi:hypothetical protein
MRPSASGDERFLPASRHDEDRAGANPVPPAAAPTYRAYMAGDMQGELMAGEADGRSAPDTASAERSERTMLLVVLAAAAGLIHAKAFIDHAPHYWLYGVFFGVLAYAQVFWAWVVYRRPRERRWLMPAAVISLAVVALWIVTRSVGLPFGPWSGRPEPLAITDITASVNELLLAGLVIAIVHPAGRVAARLRWLDGANCVRLGSMLMALSLLAVLVGNHSHPGAS